MPFDKTVRCLQDADATTESFEWLSQLRFDFDPSNRYPTAGLTARMADAKFEYGFEFLGIGERLVQTPLTDRCMALVLLARAWDRRSEGTGGLSAYIQVWL